MGLRQHSRIYFDGAKKTFIEKVGAALRVVVDGAIMGTVGAARKRLVSGYSKVGGTAGWTVGGGTVNTGLTATMAASQTAGKLVIPIPVAIGETITAFSLVGQIESGGNSVTLDADLRLMTAEAADVSDASLAAMTQLDVSADTVIGESNARKELGTPHTMAAGESLYLLLTGTTGASTDVALQGAIIESVGP